MPSIEQLAAAAAVQRRRARRPDRRRRAGCPSTSRRLRRRTRAGCGLAQRLDRQHLGGPAGGHQRGHDGDDRADEQRDHDGARLDLGGGAGQAEADARPSGRSVPWRRRCRAPAPTAEAKTPSRNASASRLRMTWRRVAPTARSSAISRDRWRDDHRERVPDDERADEQRDAGEDHEHDRHELQVLVDGVGRLLGDRARRSPPRRRRARTASSRCARAVSVTPSAALTLIASNVPA